MKISLNPIQYFDLAGVPLAAGRLKIFLHGSDTLANTYYMDGEEYIEGANPVFLDDAGEMVSTVFLDAAVYDVWVEKFVDGQYAKIQDFQFGFEPTLGKNDTIVNGITGLADADTELGTVTVVGYDSYVYCGPRTYIWDPTCTVPADGGCVVASGLSEDGRWILLTDLRELPCTYYGIKPGREANVSAFLTYQETVGQWGIQMPPVPRFLAGTYESTGTFSVTKTLMFDKGAKFLTAVFECPDVEIPEWDGYVADFYITDKNAVIHSGWFRSVGYFLTCNADHMVYDEDNYFLSATISVPFSLTSKIIEAHARLPVTYVNNGRLTYDNCSFVGKGFFNSTDVLRFEHTVFKQDWFTTMAISSWDFVNKILVRSTSLNTLLLDNFASPSVYLKAIEADGQTEADFAGRTVANISSSVLTTVRNVVCTDTISLSKPFANIVLDNVTCNSVVCSCTALTVYDSNLRFSVEPSCTALNAYRSDISSALPFVDPTILVTLHSCHVGISFRRATDNALRDATISMTDCTLYTNVLVYTKSLVMRDCRTDNATIKVYPYYSDGAYHIDVQLVGNVFVNASPVEFTKLDQDECYDCIANWTIMDNTFLGNDEGLRCRYWSNRTGSYFDKLFIVNDDRSVIGYSGNSGNCPAENCRGGALPAATSYWKDIDIGSGHIYLYTRVIARACPKYTRSESSTSIQKLYAVSTPTSATALSIAMNDDMAVSMRTGVYYWQTAGAWDDRDGDFFVLGVVLWVNELGDHESISIV